jgi:hypothetical protein
MGASLDPPSVRAYALPQSSRPRKIFTYQKVYE